MFWFAEQKQIWSRILPSGDSKYFFAYGTKTCVFYFVLPLVIYLSFHSPLLCVLQNPLNIKGPFSWIQHFCLHFTSKDMMTYKGKSLGQNHSAWQKKRIQSNSLNLLPPPSNHTTISSLTGMFCFNKVNSSANIKPEREKIRWCLHDIRQEMHHYFDKCWFCPTAQCSKIETGLEKSWHEPCPRCPLIPKLLSPLSLTARTCPHKNRTPPDFRPGNKRKTQRRVELVSLSDANTVWLRFTSRNSRTRALLQQAQGPDLSSSHCLQGNQQSFTSPGHMPWFFNWQSLATVMWAAEMLDSLSFLTNRRKRNPREWQMLWKHPKSFPVRKEGRKGVASLQGMWNWMLFFLLLSPFSEGSWSVTCPQRCKHTLRISSLIPCKATIVLGKEVVKQQNHLLEASSHTQLVLLIFAFPTKDLCEQRLLLMEEEENCAKLYFLLLSKSKIKSWLPGTDWPQCTTIEILGWTKNTYPHHYCFSMFSLWGWSTWMPPAPEVSAPNPEFPAQLPGPSQTLQKLCLDPEKNRASTLCLEVCVHHRACWSNPPFPALPSFRHVGTRLGDGGEAWAPRHKHTLDHPKGWKVCGSEVLVPVP